MKYITPDWPAPAHIKAYTTLRTGWEGKKLPEQETIDLKTIHELVDLLSLPCAPISLKQKHTANIVCADEASSSYVADGIYANKPNQICMTLTADCLPILFCDQKGTQVAAIHAGWRGLANDIIANTVLALAQDPQTLLVWLGPAIGPAHFEVGEDVFKAFIHHDAATEAGFSVHTSGKWLANLYELARIKLKKLGINQIFGGNFCTYQQADLFFSFRREKNRTGHMASLIWINEKKW